MVADVPKKNAGAGGGGMPGSDAGPFCIAPPAGILDDRDAGERTSVLGPFSEIGPRSC
jgi:hypothetical protein